MLKPTGPGICTRGGYGKTANRNQMATQYARESENLPIYRYQRAGLRIYQSINQAVSLAMYQFINLSIYQSIAQSIYQSNNKSI